MESRSETERVSLHRTIWRVANGLRGSVDGWDFKAYVLGMLSCRFISEYLMATSTNRNASLGSFASAMPCWPMKKRSAADLKGFMENAFRSGWLPRVGAAITKVLPSVARFDRDGDHALNTRNVSYMLGAFFDRFQGLGSVTSR